MKQNKLISFLNKDIKDMNKIIISLVFLITLSLVGYLSYKTNSSYAIFTDEIEGEKTIAIHYEKKEIATVLYSDGTLIINESLKDRENNIKKHKGIINEYDALSESNKYIFDIKEEKWPLWYLDKDKIKYIEIGNTIKPEDTSYWFSNIPNLERANLTNLDIERLLNMKVMFKDSGSNTKTTTITNLIIPSGSNITDILENVKGLNADISIKGLPAHYDNAFKNSATSEFGKVMLHSEKEEDFINKMIKYYGIGGLTSNGNITKGN